MISSSRSSRDVTHVARSSSCSSEFSVRKAKDKEKILLSKVSKAWEMVAASCFNLSPDSEQEQKLMDSMIVNQTLSQSIKADSDVFICKSGENPEAIALITDRGSHLELELLATHPKNIMGGEKAVKGAGTTTLHFLFQKCIAENKTSLNLYARFSSVNFYKKTGFSINNDELLASQDEYQNVPMYISAAKMRELTS